MEGINVKEAVRLCCLLAGSNIPFEVEGHCGGLVIKYPSRAKEVCSIIQHQYSYGGTSGRLEIMGLLTPKEEEYDSVVGWLSADDVYARIAAHYFKDTREV